MENLTEVLLSKSGWGVRKPHATGQYPKGNRREQLPLPRPKRRVRGTFT